MGVRDKVKGFFLGRFKQHDNAKARPGDAQQLSEQPGDDDPSEASVSYKEQSCSHDVPSSAPTSSPAQSHEEGDRPALGVPLPVSVVSVRTSQTQPAAEGSEAPTFPPISGLWDEGYDRLEQEESTSRLIADYREVLEVTLGAGKLSLEKGRRREQMEEIAKLKRDEVEASKWKLKLEAVIEPVVSIIKWSKEFVASALEPSPPASIAWAGVCLLLPVSQDVVAAQ
jgi:hypothetical protein